MSTHRTEWIEVTPAMAEKWLETKAPNRHLKENLALEYAVSMDAGEWKETHQGIAFDDKGRLVDGQHRLYAITVARKTIKLLVTRGLTQDEVLALDRGRQRTMTDSLSIYRGTRVDTHIVAVANRVMHISPYYASKAGRTPGASWRVSTAELDAFLKTHEAAMLRAIEVKHRTKSHGIASAMVGALILRAYYHLPTQRLDALIDLLATGRYDDEKKDAAGLMLRDHVISLKTGWRGTGVIDHFRLERAIKAFEKGQSLARVFPSTEELYPLPEEQGITGAVPAVIKRLGDSRAEKAKR